MAIDPTVALEDLAALRGRFGASEAEAKLACLDALDGRRLPTAEDVAHLHDVLLFLRAHPDGPEVLERSEAMLQSFDERGDLKRFRRSLDDSGIVGTWIYYAFYLTTARWLAKRFPGRLTVDWPGFKEKDRLLDRLWLLVSYAEGPGLEEMGYSLRQWIDALRADETDAEFITARLAALDAGPFVREVFYDELQLPMRLAPGEGPSRTRARLPGAGKPSFQTEPLRGGRPDLVHAYADPVRVRVPSDADAKALIELARGAMVTRSRDLSSFMHADWRDVRLFDCGDGLVFAALGLKPQQRLILESVYAFITFRNGVPMGYVLASGLFGSSEVAYNVFPPFRGGEAAHVYGRAIASIHRLFGSTVFSVDPYQLGYGNKEGLESGAWWFYYKLGFRSLDEEICALVRKENAKIKRNRRYRTPVHTLERMAADYMYLFTDGRREDVMGRLDLGGISHGAGLYLSKRFGSDRKRGTRVCAKEADRGICQLVQGF